MPILGLLSTESFSSERFKNYRRAVFYQYPNGAAPLTGILSLMDSEDTDDPEFNWYEKRFTKQRTTTASHSASKGPFANSSDVVSADPVTLTADTEFTVTVASNSGFRVGHIIKIPVTTGGTTTTDWKAIVSENPATTGAGKLQVRSLKTVASVDNGTTNENVGREVLIIGSAFAQGATDTTQETYNLPTMFTNYTQIFRTPFSITGTALKTQAKFDESGPYKDKAKEHSLLHMIELEKNFIFGQKTTYVDGNGLPTYTSGGILHFLERWEAGDYGAVTASADTDDDKRIIENTSGTINEKTLDGYMERLFRSTNNSSNEKLCLCGSGYLNVMNQLWKSKSTLMTDLPMTDTYGMDVVKSRSPFGTVYYKTHPLFNQNDALRYNALFLDVKNLKYRYISGRDTELLKDRQARDADYRKDEYLTECGLEVRIPESHMYIKNVTDYVP